MTRFYAWLAAGTVGVALAAGVALVVYPLNDRACGGSPVAAANGAVGGAFTLVSHEGAEVTEADVIRGPTLVYFGYTYCPDICPVDLARNAEAMDLLAERGLDLPGLFISVDPERDTPGVLADFVEVMHPKLTGLTGSPEQVAAAAKAYRVYYRKAGEGEDYLVDHLTFTYLMSPEGLIDHFRRDASAEDVANRAACHIG